jgi:threonine/homoserine/homoserine lactone efflux protein
VQQAIIIASILGALAVGVVSPGPSFVLVARISVAGSRRDGVAAALGMGGGGVIFASLALMGLQAVLISLPWLYTGVRLVGGIYLVYLAIMLWRGAPEPIALPDAGAPVAAAGRSFWLGLSTQLSNPKTTIVYASVFAALMPADVPRWLFAVLPPLIFMLEAGWYAIVALVFSTARPRAAYLRAKVWIDRVAGAVIGALGARLLYDAARSTP